MTIYLPCISRKKMKKAVPNPPLVANRRPKNPKDILLVRATMKPHQQLHKGSNPCGRPLCKSFAHIRAIMTFESARTGERFRALITANCRTKNIMYLIECSKCRKQCIGETERVPLVPPERVPLVVTFHLELTSLGKILPDHLPTLHISKKI